MSTVELKAVRKQYGAVEIIKGVDLSVRDREFVVFVGPSGCGKSTLLRMIAGLEEISSGDLLISEYVPGKSITSAQFPSGSLHRPVFFSTVTPG